MQKPNRVSRGEQRNKHRQKWRGDTAPGQSDKERHQRRTFKGIKGSWEREGGETKTLFIYLHIGRKYLSIFFGSECISLT